jgi:cytidyltransferase-like protein
MRGAVGKSRSKPDSTVVVTASLDNLGSADVRFLQEAARLGPVHVRVPSDALIERATGRPPTFPEAERRFLAASIRCVNSVGVVDRDIHVALPRLAPRFAILAVREGEDDGRLRAAWAARGRALRTIPRGNLDGFPAWAPDFAEAQPPLPGDPPRTIVTGCYDWLHSGHVRFFMDAAALGQLYVVVGSDRNVELLKGPGHPLLHEDERRYLVGAIRQVFRCLVSSGSGWMDAEPEIARIEPQYYVVNEDNDQLEKREFCASRGIEYVVLNRKPHRGLPARSSTILRGF